MYELCIQTMYELCINYVQTMYELCIDYVMDRYIYIYIDYVLTMYRLYVSTMYIYIRQFLLGEFTTLFSKGK
jgi:hypothetical protein